MSKKRVGLYTRVSSEDQVDNYSLEAQRDYCERFCALKDWKIVEYYSDPGRSGKSIYRPDFQRMLDDAKQKQLDIVLVHKMDRFSRSVIDVLTTLRELRQYDVAFVSASEDFDFSTPIGSVVLTILAAFAQWYLDNLSAETKKGKRQRALAGDWNGTLAFGYTTPDRLKKRLTELGQAFRDGRLELTLYERKASVIENSLERYAEKRGNQAIPCPFTSDGVKMAFRMYATGQYSDREIADMLNESSYVTTGQFGENPFGKDTARDMLQTRFYIGKVPYNVTGRGKSEVEVDGNHEPLIDEPLFETCQRVRLRRRDRLNQAAKAQHAHPYLLASMLRCPHCDSPIYGWDLRGQKRYRFTCRDHGFECIREKHSLDGNSIEQQAESIVIDMSIPSLWKSRVLEMIGQHKSVSDAETKIEVQLARLKNLYVRGDLSESEYQSNKVQLDKQMAQVRDAKRWTPDQFEVAKRLLGDTGRLWRAATLEEKREWLRLMFDKMYVDGGRITAVVTTPICWEILTKDTQSGDDGFQRQASNLWLLPYDTPLETIRLLSAA